MTKLCKDCRHFRAPLTYRLMGLVKYGRCEKFIDPSYLRFSKVTDVKPSIDDMQFASISRSSDIYCGPNARLWKAK